MFKTTNTKPSFTPKDDLDNTSSDTIHVPGFDEVGSYLIASVHIDRYDELSKGDLINGALFEQPTSDYTRALGAGNGDGTWVLNSYDVKSIGTSGTWRLLTDITNRYSSSDGIYMSGLFVKVSED